jgi:transcription antitermination factor NusG
MLQMEKWYVAHSKPRHEELLWNQFCIRNLEAYYPCIKVNPVNPRARKVQPYFPGYLFVHADLELVSVSSLAWIPGGVGLVSFGDEPAFVPDSLVFTIKQRVDALMSASEKVPVSLNKGDSVVIHEGAFKDYEGIFDIYLSGTDRVRVLLSLLGNRQIPVELSAGSIHRINQN